MIASCSTKIRQFCIWKKKYYMYFHDKVLIVFMQTIQVSSNNMQEFIRHIYWSYMVNLIIEECQVICQKSWLLSPPENWHKSVAFRLILNIDKSVVPFVYDNHYHNVIFSNLARMEYNCVCNITYNNYNYIIYSVNYYFLLIPSNFAFRYVYSYEYPRLKWYITSIVVQNEMICMTFVLYICVKKYVKKSDRGK